MPQYLTSDFVLRPGNTDNNVALCGPRGVGGHVSIAVKSQGKTRDGKEEMGVVVLSRDEAARLARALLSIANGERQ